MVRQVTASRSLVLALFTSILINLTVVSAAWATRAETRFRGPTMGTTWTVVLPVDVELKVANRVQRAIEAELAIVNGLMSSWDASSELSRFNDDQSEGFLPLSTKTGYVLAEALAVSKATDGAYDVLLGEVFDLYAQEEGGNGSLGPDSMEHQALVDDALRRSRTRAMERRGGTWRKPHPRVRVDLSSIAKGYAVDRVGELLETLGYPRYLVEIGGEVRTRGRAGDDERWAVGIETPDGNARSGLMLEDAHVASSGSYRNWQERDGKRFSHVIDGRDGRPITHDLVAVTVIAETTLRADAWATALLVVGVAAAKEHAQRERLEVQLVSRESDGFTVWRSQGFMAQLAD